MNWKYVTLALWTLTERIVMRITREWEYVCVPVMVAAGVSKTWTLLASISGGRKGK